MMFYVEAKSRSKSSTGSRSSGRRNVLVFRRSAFSRYDDDDNDDDIFDKELPASVSPAPHHHCNDQAVGDLQTDDAAKDDATHSDKTTAAAALTMTADSNDQMAVSGVPSTSCNSDVHTELGKHTNDLSKVNVMSNTEPTIECDASSLNSAGMEPRPRSLTKGEIPKFYSLHTSPPSAKRKATASRAARDDRKHGKSAASKTTKSKTALQKKTAASDKSRVARSVSDDKTARSHELHVSRSVSDDRRLTFLVKGVKEDTASEKMRSRSSADVLEDCCDADVEDIMDQNEEILQDVSDCSELFPDNDNNTLVLSPSNCSSVTLVHEGSCSLVSGIPSNTQHSSAYPGRPTEKVVTDNVSTKPVHMPAELQAADVTSLVVTDMELTDIINTTVSSGNVSDNMTSETASDSTNNMKTDSRHDAEETIYYAANRDIREPVEDKDDNRALSTFTQPISKKIITLSKRSKTSTSVVAHEENLNNIQQKSDAENHPLGNCDQVPIDGRQKQSVRVRPVGAHKNQRKTTVTAPTVFPVQSVRDKEMEKPGDFQGTTNSKMSANSKRISAEAVGAPEGHQWCHGSQILQTSTASKVASDSDSEEQTADILPKKVAAYMTKPGKIVYSTAQRRSTSSERAASKSRSKSRSTLPLQSKPRSKQLLVTADLPADSPSSTFSFDGTPKEDTVCRPAALLAARKKFISMDDSMVVSEPAEKPPVMLKRSLSSDDVASSPHGIMLMLHNGKRTKPRPACSKSVRYCASEIVNTPSPVAEHRKADVPLTPYARASDNPSHTSPRVSLVRLNSVGMLLIIVFDLGLISHLLVVIFCFVLDDMASVLIMFC